MKTMAFTLKIGFIMLLLLASVDVCLAQGSKKERDSIQAAKIRVLVDNQAYFFMAQSTTPSRGGLKQLTAGYYFRVSKDTLESDLPYFGRAYTASYGSTDGGIKFTSTDFDYKIEPTKKGGWDITISSKEMGTPEKMNLIIFTDGTANLNVRPRDKQPIDFRGYISETKR